MARSILEVHFPRRISESDLQDGSANRLTLLDGVPGLIWKAWVYDSTHRITGGVYHFDSKHSARACINGPVFEALKDHFGSVDYEIFDLAPVSSRA